MTFWKLLLITLACEVAFAAMAVAQKYHEKNVRRREILIDAGPRAIPNYITMSQGYYYAYGSGASLEPKGGSYYTCQEECDSRAECWGMQTTWGCEDRLGCCQALILSDPTNINMIKTGGSTVFQKSTQMWDEEYDRCMGLQQDVDAEIVGECETNCVVDDNCDVYQWMSDDTCWRGKSTDCCPSNNLDDFQVSEGYRKQEIEWVEQLTQCLGLVEDEAVSSAANCQGNCEFDVDCEVWQFYTDKHTCWRGKPDQCIGAKKADEGAIKNIINPNNCPEARRLLRIFKLD